MCQGLTYVSRGWLPRWLRGEEFTCYCRVCGRHRFDPWGGRIPWRRKWQPTPVFLPGKSHGQRGLAGCRPQGFKELDTAEGLSTHSQALSCCTLVSCCIPDHHCIRWLSCEARGVCRKGRKREESALDLRDDVPMEASFLSGDTCPNLRFPGWVPRIMPLL